MDVWLTYSLHDLLIFSPDSFFRLFERSNQAFWPFHLVVIAIALLMLYLTATRTFRAQQFVLVGLALFWLLSAWWFIFQYFLQINTIAGWYLMLFNLQAGFILLFALYCYIKRKKFTPANDTSLGIGLGIAGYALIIHPFLGVFCCRSWLQIELLGLSPDATAIASLGLIIALGNRKLRYLLLIIPLLWIVISAMTYSTFSGHG